MESSIFAENIYYIFFRLYKVKSSGGENMHISYMSQTIVLLF